MCCSSRPASRQTDAYAATVKQVNARGSTAREERVTFRGVVQSKSGVHGPFAAAGLPQVRVGLTFLAAGTLPRRRPPQQAAPDALEQHGPLSNAAEKEAA